MTWTSIYTYASHPSPSLPRPDALLLCALLPCVAQAQAINVFNNTDSTWTNPAAWTPSGPPGTVDTAQFATLGTTAGVLNQPVVGSAITIGQLGISNTAFGSGWTLTGSGAVTAGSATVSGLNARGIGNQTINLGNGTASSLILTGSTGNTLNGAINVGHGSAVKLTGNTVGSLGTSDISIHGGSLILDNSAGNPVNQRLAGTGAINLQGGTSVLEFRSDAAGTNFTGLSGQLAVNAGDGVIRVNQTGSVPLNITFGSLSRSNTSRDG